MRGKSLTCLQASPSIEGVLDSQVGDLTKGAWNNGKSKTCRASQRQSRKSRLCLNLIGGAYFFSGNNVTSTKFFVFR